MAKGNKATKTQSDTTISGTVVRLLLDCSIDGIKYATNDVVRMPSNLVEAAVEQGLVDPHPDAVAYAMEQSGGVVKTHPTAESAAEDAQAQG